MEATKVCTKCSQEKPVSGFYRQRSTSSGYEAMCKACHKVRYPNRHSPGKGRERWLRSHFNLSLEEYDEMLWRQGGVCAICKLPQSGKKMNPAISLAVDHSHEYCPEHGRSCGACVRGLLCVRCNLSLGWLERLRADIDSYLAAYESRRTIAA